MTPVPRLMLNLVVAHPPTILHQFLRHGPGFHIDTDFSMPWSISKLSRAPCIILLLCSLKSVNSISQCEGNLATLTWQCCFSSRISWPLIIVLSLINPQLCIIVCSFNSGTKQLAD